MKALKEYGLKFKDLKTVVKAFNESGILETTINTVAVKGEVVLEALLDAIDSLSTKEVKRLPKAVTKFYKALPQGVFDDSEPEETEPELEETEPEPEPEPEETDPSSSCPTFKTGFSATEKDCKSCKKDFPDEHTVCKKATKAATKAAKAAKAEKKPTVKRVKGRTRYGHVIGSMSGDVDEMLYKGMNIKAMAKKLAKDHNRELKVAHSKVRGHVVHLNSKGIKVDDKEGFLSTSIEFAEGYNKDNTETS